MFIKSQNNRSIVNSDFCSGFYVAAAGQDTPELGRSEQARIFTTCDGEELVIALYKTDEQAEEILDFIAVCLAQNNGKVTTLPTQDEIERVLDMKKSGASDELLKAFIKKANSRGGGCDAGKESTEAIEELLGKLFKGVL